MRAIARYKPCTPRVYKNHVYVTIGLVPEDCEILNELAKLHDVTISHTLAALTRNSLSDFKQTPQENWYKPWLLLKKV